MDFESIWKKALNETEVIRARISSLQTFSDTHVPYILLCESSINSGDTVVRKGEMVVQKPSLVLPPNLPQFEGFEFEGLGDDFQESAMLNFLLVRGIQLPSLSYNNSTYSLDIFEGRLAKAVEHYQQELVQQENVSTGLLIGSEELWQMSLLIFICGQISRNTEMDFRKLLDQQNRKDRLT